MGSEQVPAVAGDVDEHRHASVGLVAWLRHELDAVVEHPPPGGLEVVDSEEEADPAGVLPPDEVHLLLTVRLGEEQPGLRARRSNDDPPLRAPVVRGRRRVFDELEAEGVDEEPDGVVVVLDDQRGVLQVQGRTVRRRSGARLAPCEQDGAVNLLPGRR